MMDVIDIPEVDVNDR